MSEGRRRRRPGAPLPPADFASRDLPIEPVALPRVLYRIHGSRRDAIFFGPPTGDPESRFDDPEGGFKVCYLGQAKAGAFVETMLRAPALRFIAWRAIEERSMAHISVVRALSLVAFDGPGLRSLGATLEVLGTRDYSLSGAWSRAVHEHPEQPDGIRYPCRHDNSEYGIALFERAGASLMHLMSQPLDQDRAFLAEMSGRYRFGLV